MRSVITNMSLTLNTEARCPPVFLYEKFRATTQPNITAVLDLQTVCSLKTDDEEAFKYNIIYIWEKKIVKIMLHALNS